MGIVATILEALGSLVCLQNTWVYDSRLRDAFNPTSAQDFRSDASRSTFLYSCFGIAWWFLACGQNQDMTHPGGICMDEIWICFERGHPWS